MVLRLYWKDIKGNIYELGDLYKENDEYCFDIVEHEILKKATRAGCYGIGELDLRYQKHRSKELFGFFERRIPAKDHVKIKEILEELQMQEYDEMELLRKTKGYLLTDRYYLEEV